MSGKKEKKTSFKDILRNSFPVDMDDLLEEQERERPPEKPSPSTQAQSDSQATTIPQQSTVPDQVTVAPPDTVSLRGTVAPSETVSPVGTVSPDSSLSFFPEGADHEKVEITSNYFLMDADVFDVLALHQDAYEQLVYSYLYRQSYGRNRQTCFVGLKSIIEGCQISKNSVRRTLSRLEQKQHIKVIETVNQRNMKGTIYRVFLPCEIPGLNSRTTFMKQ